jgi:hydrogenase nickel incorporation protein HypB
MKIVAAKQILKANDQLAAENRLRFQHRGVFGVNLVGSPGCGKTTLLESLFRTLRGRVSPAVIEGDIAGQIDADRMTAMGVPVVQINTDGMCHLDANMIAAAWEGFEGDADQAVDMLIVENVGNLVCTAGYDLGEHLRIVVLSVSEGDDKLVKYPAIFQRSQALVITKMDLLPYTNFNIERVRGDMHRLNPDAEIFAVSALQGDGMDGLADWLAARRSVVPAMSRS